MTDIIRNMKHVTPAHALLGRLAVTAHAQQQQIDEQSEAIAFVENKAEDASQKHDLLQAENHNLSVMVIRFEMYLEQISAAAEQAGFALPPRPLDHLPITDAAQIDKIRQYDRDVAERKAQEKK